MATVRGPFFSPNIDSVVDAGAKAIERKVAAEGERRIGNWMRKFFKHPTPYYWLHVLAKPRADFHVVTDGGIIYGPWLAGIGSRNRSTQFKGYAHWRLTTQELNDRKEMAYIVDPVVHDICKVLNG